MADIVELIAKLSLEVGGNEELKKQIDLFNQQTQAIDKLVQKRDNLNKAAAIAEKNNNSEGAKKAKTQSEQLTKAINGQTAALAKQVQQQQLIARAAQQELGIIQKLQDKLSDLQRVRDRSTSVSDIRSINNEISQLNEELSSLTSNAEKGALSQLFGISGGLGVGKQLLQGGLAGLGIGVGFSVIPALTSSLVELLRAELDVTTQQGILVKSNESMKQSFAGLAEEVLRYNQELIDIANIEDRANTVEESKRLLEATKALGVIQGETFDAEKRNLEAGQKLRADELTDLNRKKKVYDEINTVLEKSARFSAEFTGSPDVQAFGDPNKNQNVQYELFNNFARNLDRSSLPRDIVDKTVQVLREAYDNANTFTGFKGVSLTKVLTDELKKYGADAAKLGQEIADKQNEIEAAKLEFQSKIAAETYQLNKKLSQENADNEIRLQQEEIARQEVTTANINKQYNLRGRLATEALNREFEEARKAGTLTASVKSEFDRKFEQIEQGNEAERLAAIKRYNVAQVQEQSKLNEQLLQQELQSLTQRLQLLTGVELQANVDLRNTITQKELLLQKQSNAAQYDEQVRALEKKAAEMERAGNTETQEYQQLLDNLYNIFVSYQTKQDGAEAAAQAKRIRNIQQGYADVVSVIRQESAVIARETEVGFSERNLAISERGGGGFFGRGFASNIAGLRNRRNVAGNTASQAEAETGKARQQLRALQVELENATEENRATAQLAVDNAEAEVLRLEGIINNAHADINNSTRDITLAYVNAWADTFKQVGDLALQGYNTLAEYRQQDIDREISAREAQLQIGLELAKRGNTEVLDEQRNALRQARKEERAVALEQQAINAAMQLSYATLAIAKAAAEGGGIASAATVAAAVGALITGYSFVRSANAQQQTRGFKDGEIDIDGPGTSTSDSIPARLSKGESVMTARATSMFGDELRLMQQGIDPYKGLNMAALRSDTAFVTRGELTALSSKLDEVTDAIRSKQVSVETITTKDHISHMVNEQTRVDRRKFGQSRK